MNRCTFYCTAGRCFNGPRRSATKVRFSDSVCLCPRRSVRPTCSSSSQFVSAASVWDLYERVLLAAADCARPDIADHCLRALIKRFGAKSLRVRTLAGSVFEMDDERTAQSAELETRTREAEKQYDHVLKADPVNMAAWKRKVAVCKAEGDLTSATIELNQYLEVFQTDEQAWQELFDLYVAQRKFELAKFAAEELITSAPENYLYHLQYADVLYSLGGRANVELASVYYSQSLELNMGGKNLRALYGTVLVRNEWCDCSRVFPENIFVSSARRPFFPARSILLFLHFSLFSRPPGGAVHSHSQSRGALDGTVVGRRGKRRVGGRASRQRGHEAATRALRAQCRRVARQAHTRRPQPRVPANRAAMSHLVLYHRISCNYKRVAAV